MTASTFKDLLFPAALLTGAMFTALTVPLAVVGYQTGAKPLEISFQDEQLSVGTVADVALPYMGLAATLSLAAGGATLGLGQWRRSLQSSKQASQQVLTLEQQLKQTQTELEEAMFSDSQLQSSGLSFFLGDSPLPAAPTPVLGTVTMGLQALQLDPVSSVAPEQDAVSAMPLLTELVSDLSATPLPLVDLAAAMQPNGPIAEPAAAPAQPMVAQQPRVEQPSIMQQPVVQQPVVQQPVVQQPVVQPLQSTPAFVPLADPVVARNSATPFHSGQARRPAAAQMSPLPAAQSYLSFARNPTAAAAELDGSDDLSIVAQVQQIQLQIGQLTAQMESLQTMVHQTIAVSAYTDYVAYSYPQQPQGRYPVANTTNNVQALRPNPRSSAPKSPYIVNRSVDFYGAPQSGQANNQTQHHNPAQPPVPASQWVAS
jgi:hypothetical protein